MSRKRQHEDAASNDDDDDDDIFVYYDHTDPSTIPSGIISLRIDSSVKKIPPRAFRMQYNLTTVQYEEGLQVIGNHAFFGCSSLQEQQFPSTLIEIGKRAFWECKRLESVGCLPLSLALIKEKAFYYCTRLQSIEITNHMLRLEEGVFEQCFGLTHVRLPLGMVNIPDSLFCRCKWLVDVNVPSSVIEIGGHAFAGCKRLSEIELPTGLNTVGAYAFGSSGLKRFHCPIAVESIGGSALSECKYLESVILPPKLEVIPDSMFSGCIKLKDAGICIPQSVVQIGEGAFSECDGLTQLDLSRFKITSIGPSAFASCSNLRNVMLPQSVVQIGEGAFSDCDGLTQLDLSCLEITSIGSSAFRGCFHLRSIMLPRKSLKRIERQSFEYCRSLTHLWVPPTVEYIDEFAFVCCTSLLSVEVPETLKRLVFVYDFDDPDRDVCGYESLVNIYLPRSHQVGMDDVESFHFMQEMKLREAEGNYSVLVEKLKRRFNSLPLHRACYFQSYHSLQENTQRFQSILQSDKDGPTRACERIDFLGMTPFHILALSQIPRLGLFQELLSASKSSADIILKCRDVFGCTPLDYLCKNIHTPLAVSVTKSLLPIILERRISFLGLELWRNDILSDLDKVQIASEDATMPSLAANVTSVFQKLSKLERMEVLSLLEMSVWKKKLEDEKATGSDTREKCRINCGSRVVSENVIPLLGGSDTDS